jgi:hypothetical protein
MTTVTDTLDNILSGSSEAAPETNEHEEVVTQVAEEVPQEQIEAEQPEGTTQGTKFVPHEALHAEKQKVKRYTDEVVDLRKSNEALQRQITEVLQRIPVPKQEQAEAVDPIDAFFKDPTGAAREAVNPQFQQLQTTLQAITKDIAITRFTEETVSAAEAAFNEAAKTGSIDPAVHAKINNSPNPWAAAVQWHKQQAARAEIGDDPAAFRAKLEAEILAKHGLTADGQATEVLPPKTTVMPSNLTGARNVGTRSAPAWSGPPSLTDIFDTSR